MKLYQTLETALKKEPNFVTDNGEIKKWVIITKAQNHDAELISSLLDDVELKEEFFIKIKDVLVFNQALFVQFMEQKNYLNDSYTAYKNKVGLTIDGRYLKQRNEVALVWPFKDCVLEGGQSREEDKRDEIFFNEILAQDEITQLLEPKIFTNAKRYSDKGEYSFDNFNRNDHGTITDNLIIKGNNLLSLHTLKEEFAGKVKLIYIDPPFNTGTDSFKYNDSFNHSTWLTFMKNRLEVAKELLHDKGSIFVQCDYHEDSYLRILMDEIFGRANLVQTITVKMSEASGPKMAHAKKLIPKLKDTLLIYCKKEFEIVNVPSVTKQRWDNEYAKFLTNFAEDDFEIISNIFIKDICLDSDIDTVNEIFKKVKLSTISQEEKENKNDNDWLNNNAWRIIADKQNTSLDKLLSAIMQHPLQDIACIKTKRGKPVLYRTDKNFGEDSRVEIVFAKNNLSKNPCDIWTDITTSGGFSEEGGVSLPRGKKPETLLKRIIEMCTREKDIVLDYHLGSGTTAAVAHKLDRQYIGSEQLDYGDNAAHIRLKNVITGDNTGISKAIKWHGGGTFVYLELKKYNQTFIEQIEEAKDTNALMEIWQMMKAKSFLNYNVDIKKQDAHIEEFKSLTLAEQKHHLVELLDKNQLYVNLSSMNDTDFAITDEEKRVTKDFYQLKK